MQFLTCFYNEKLPGSPWDLAIEMALAGYSSEERRKSKRDDQMQLFSEAPIEV